MDWIGQRVPEGLRHGRLVASTGLIIAGDPHQVLLVGLRSSEQVYEAAHHPLLLLKVFGVRWLCRLVRLVLDQRREQLEQRVSLRGEEWQEGGERGLRIERNEGKGKTHHFPCPHFTCPHPPSLPSSPSPPHPPLLTLPPSPPHPPTLTSSPSHPLTFLPSHPHLLTFPPSHLPTLPHSHPPTLTSSAEDTTAALSTTI